MVRKKGKGKQITSKQIFITLLLVLIVAFGAIFLFSGTGENVAGQAGYSGPTKNVYIKNTLSGEYLCGGVKYVPSSNNFLYELNTCKTIDAEGTKWDILTLGSLSRIQVATVAKNVLCTGSKFSFSAKVCNGVIPGYAVTTTINEVDGVSSVQFSENKGYLCSSDNGEIANCNALHKSVTYNGYNGNWGTYWIIGDKNFVTKSSVDSCSPEGVSKDDNKKLCYNKGWVTCGKDWISPEKYDGKYLCPGKVQEVWLECNPENNGVTNKHNQRYCDGTKWLSCTKELDGTYKGDRQCVSGFWVTDASIGDDKLFEVTIDKTKRKINGLNYDLCDLNTASLSDRATICRENVQVIPTVYSLQALKLKADLKPVIYDIGDSTKVLLKYIEPADQNKIVSMVLHKNIGSVLVNTNDKKENQIPQITIYKATFSLGTFSSNLAAGQRLALQLIGQPEIYLLSHPKDELFSFDKLQMEELKGSSTITKETKGNFYQFKFPGGFITVEDKGTSVEISSLKAGEAAVSSAKINILNEVYEIPFDFGNPVKLKDFGEDVISVCTNDQAKDPTALRVCLNNNPIEGELINEGILTKIKISEGKELAMLYRYENDKKTGYLFHLIDINEKGTLVDYNFFPEAMATGRRLALEFSGHLYLLAHPVKNVIAMSEASIQTFTKDKNPEDKLIGDNFRAEALVADGKIIVERDATKTQLPYTLKGLTKSQLAEVDIDLSQEFHTQMSSKIPVKITNENLGIVAVDPANDIAKDFNTFKIIAAGTQKTYLLKDKMPVVEGKVLFYYVAQGDIKKADLYYLHNLDEKLLYKQDYDDAFIKTFTAGKKIALLYKGQYYLLGFKGTSNAFVISDVTLETIGGSPIVGTAVGSKIDFAVPDSILSVWIQNNKEGKDTIFFTAEDLSTKTFQEEQYSTVLTPASKIKIGTVTYSLNDEGVTAGKEGGVFLEISNANPVLLNKDVVWLDEINKNNHLFWYQGTKNGVKTVSIQPIVIIDSNVVELDDWSNILDKAKDAKSKALYWQGEYFEFVGDKSLSSFSLRSIPEGNTYPIQNFKEGTNFLSNGTFAFKEHLLFAEQTPAQDITKASLKLTPVTYNLLTSAGLNTTAASAYKSPLSFVTTVGGPLYSISYSKVNNNDNNLFITGSLFSPLKLFLKMALPEGKPTKILFPDLTTATIEVLNTTTSEIKITK